MALIDQKKEIEKTNQKNQAIPGVDIPISPELVNKLF